MKQLIRRPVLVGTLAAALAMMQLLAGTPAVNAAGRRERRQAARLHRRAAKAAMSGDYVKASQLWNQAYQLTRNHKYLYNLARIADETDRPSKAMALFERFLRVTEARVSRYRRLRTRSKKHLLALRKRVAVLMLEVPQPGARIVVDRRAVGQGPYRKLTRLDPGPHVITVELKGHHAETRQLTIAADQLRELTISLRKIKPKIVTKVRMQYPFKRWISWAVAGAGAAIIAAGIGPLAHGARQLKAFDDYVNDQPPGEATDDSLKTRGERARDVGVVLMVIGGLTGAAGVTMAVFNRPRQVPADQDDGEGARPRPGVTVAPAVGRGHWGLTVRGRF